MRTLVVHTGGIGDFLLACPAISNLEGTVELLGRSERLELAVEARIAERAHELDATEFHTLLASPSPRIQAFLERYDRVIVWMRDPDGRLEVSIRSCGVNNVQLFPGLPDADWTGHASEYYAACLDLHHDPEFRLNIAPEHAWHDVVIHPGSGSAAKNWPMEHFQHVATMLHDEGRRIEWCVGPAERESTAYDALEPRVGSGTLIDLARTLAATRLYIGNDSGITHLAASVGCPAVAVFGPTDPRMWGPTGEHVRISHDQPWPDTSTVLERCHELLSR